MFAFESKLQVTRYKLITIFINDNQVNQFTQRRAERYAPVIITWAEISAEVFWDTTNDRFKQAGRSISVHEHTFESGTLRFRYRQPVAKACRIKTDHSNLVSCFGPRMRALAKVFYRGESRGKIPCQRPNPRAKTWHKIWITGLNPNYDTTPIQSLQNSQNKCQKSSFTYDHRRHLILPLPPVHALPTVNASTCC